MIPPHLIQTQIMVKVLRPLQLIGLDATDIYSGAPEGDTFTLYSLQYELDEELLQLFIAVVDAELQHSELQILIMNTILQTQLKIKCVYQIITTVHA